jgi:hypothetical protein
MALGSYWASVTARPIAACGGVLRKMSCAAADSRIG